MGLRKVNHFGRPVVLPFEEGTGMQIKEALGFPKDRTLAIRTESGLREIPDHQKVDIPEGAEMVDIPFHEYGGASGEVGRRLRVECEELSRRYNQPVAFGYDPHLSRWWVRLPKFPLPEGWGRRTAPVMVTLLDHYPFAAPDGFLLPSTLRDKHGRPPSHYYAENGRHALLTSMGYGWFCLHAVGWQGDHDYHDGDSVAKYFALIEIALARVVRN